MRGFGGNQEITGLDRLEDDGGTDSRVEARIGEVLEMSRTPEASSDSAAISSGRTTSVRAMPVRIAEGVRTDAPMRALTDCRS